MTSARSGNATESSWLGTTIKLFALVLGGATSLLLLTSVGGLWIDTLWLRVSLAIVVGLAVPLLVADRLLPNNGTARPGLVGDVLALAWMGCALAAWALGAGPLQGALAGEAERHDATGMPRSAWALRWIAGVDAPVPTPVSPPSDEVLAAVPSTPVTVTPPVVVAPAEFTPAPTEGTRTPLEPAAVFERWAPSVVTIAVDGQLAGTGFVIDARGTIATNHHVVEHARRLAIKLFDGSEVDEVELLETDAEHDLALVRAVTDKSLPPVVLGVSDAVVVGEKVVVIGNPLGLEHTLTDGLVSARRLYEGKKYIQMSAPVSPGNSGGPVFNRFGDVVGVTVAKLHGENLNLAVPIDLLKPMIKSEYPNARALGKSRW